MKNKRKFFFLIPILFMNGCFDGKKEEVFKTVEYYIKNKDAREKRKKDCMNMKDVTETIAMDCKNVDIAIRRTDKDAGTTPDFSSCFKK